MSPAATNSPGGPPSGARDPIVDLRRIAFLLERSLASSYRVKAFRGAASALLPLGPDEVAARVQDGSLQKISGVGEKTAAVIAESVVGAEPEYLARLESQAAGVVATGGEDLLEQLRGDLHSHSDWSDGGSPPAEMAWTAKELGHDYLALTDHSPRLKVANGLSADRLRRQLGIIKVINEQLAPFRVLTGIEVDILEDGTLDQDPELLAQLDVVVASVHSKLAMSAPAMTRRMLAAIADPNTDILGHCTGRMVRGREGRHPNGRAESEFDAKAVFAACAEQGTAVEINSRPERLDPPRRLLRLAVEAGCVFSIDTDAHAPGQLDWQGNGAARAVDCGVSAERVINTWAMGDLLAWTSGSQD
jgi:putative hydrolase